jgi:N-acetylmuramoyl-L-alanine amidase
MNKLVQNYKITPFFLIKDKLNSIFYAIFILLLLGNATYSTAQKKNSELQTIKTVCIDAGHGGKDPGCHGASSNEKTVCLSMALKLGEKIKSTYPEIKVIYTRDKDVFVELDDRAAYANKNHADLFICIHANAASSAAYGTETYVLGLHKTEAQQRVADRENSTIFLEDDKGEKYKLDQMTPEAIIIKQLQLSTFLDLSILFAAKLQAEFKKIGRYDRGVKQAGFLVLWKTTMPAVLIETGFLTNLQEEQFLASSSNQDKMAETMFTAFKNYKNELEGIDVLKNVQSTYEPNISRTESIELKEKPVVKTDGKVVFMVQVETSDSKIALTSSRFKGLSIFEYKQDGFYKYASGEFENDFSSASSYKNELREKGFQHAFVIAFQNGQRIDLDQALKEIKK